MKSEEIYQTWKEQKSQIRVSENFQDKVMNQIYQYEQAKRKPLFDINKVIEFVSSHPFAKVGLIAVGAVAGVLRVAFVVCVFLWS